METASFCGLVLKTRPQKIQWTAGAKVLENPNSGAP